MAVYLFGAPPKNQRGEVQLLRPGMLYRWVVSAPSPAEAKRISAQHRLGFRENQGQHRICYQMIVVPANVSVAEILAVEAFHGQAEIRAEPVRAAMPDSRPQGQRGMNRMDGPRGADGFEVLGDGALDGGGDAMYGPPNDGTWTDLMMGRGGLAVEVPRGQ